MPTKLTIKVGPWSLAAFRKFCHYAAKGAPVEWAHSLYEMTLTHMPALKPALILVAS